LKANGWLLLNGEKMAKRTGNFVTLADACKRYGCDAMRFALACAGDGMDDPNFTVENVDTAILQIFTLTEWVKEMLENKEKMRHTPPADFSERLFAAEMSLYTRKTEQRYERMEFREAVTSGFFDMQKVCQR
jgi:leucyl-tRNA synthetase